MKKILLAVTAALAITSCSQNEEFENEGQKKAINFESVVNNVTRATEVTTNELKNQGFHVYAYNTGENILGTGVLNKSIMENETVLWDTGSNTWISGTYYWPSTGKVQFFAYSSSKTLALTASASDKYPILAGYQVATTSADQEDLLVATVNDKTKTDIKVGFVFSHVLTQINFSIKSEKDDNLTYTVSKIEIGEVKNQGTYKYADNTWDNLQGAVKYSYALNDVVTDNSVEGTTAKAIGTESLMLLPQSLDGAKILVSYKVTDKNGDEVYATETPKEVDLKSTSWGVGNRVRYVLSLTNDATAIGWDSSSVKSWTDKSEDEREGEPKAPTV